MFPIHKSKNILSKSCSPQYPVFAVKSFFSVQIFVNLAITAILVFPGPNKNNNSLSKSCSPPSQLKVTYPRMRARVFWARARTWVTFGENSSQLIKPKRVRARLPRLPLV